MLFFLGSKLSYQPELFFHAPTNIPHFVSKIIYYCFENIENLSLYTVCSNFVQLNSINRSNSHDIYFDVLDSWLLTWQVISMTWKSAKCTERKPLANKIKVIPALHLWNTLFMLYFGNGHKTIKFAASQHEKKKSSSMSLTHINRLFLIIWITFSHFNFV